MTHYVDTSAFLKLVVREKGSTALRRWVRAPGRELVSSELMRVEALRAARRSSPAAISAVRASLPAIALVSMSSTVCDLAAVLDPPGLRSLDAIHLASALLLGDSMEGIVTYDDRMIEAAAELGLPVVSPGT